MFSEQFCTELASEIAKQVLAHMADQVLATKRLFTLAEAAEYLGRSEKGVRHMIERGTIPATRLDGKIQIDRTVLDKLIADNTYFVS
jgi:excisionase family DNA binding protein